MRWLVLVALLAAGCAGAPLPTSTPTSTPVPTPTATPTEVVSASPTVGLLDLCDTADREGCELAPGTYSPSLTTPKMTFTLPEGWVGVRHYPDGWSLIHEGVILSFARDVTFGEDEPAEPGLAGFEQMLRSASALQVGDAQVTEIGGVPAVQLDVVAVDDASGLLALDADRYNLSEGQKARFVVFAIGESIAMFIVESFDEAGFDAAVATAQPVLDSVAFEQ